MNIVIADDAGYIVELLRNIFEEQGHHVIGVAKNGHEAIELTSQLKPDVLFLDLVMPDMNGLEAAKEILSLNPQQNIITCSSLDTKWVEEKAIETGCKSYLLKPFTKDQVAASLRQIEILNEGKKHG